MGYTVQCSDMFVWTLDVFNKICSSVFMTFSISH